VLRKTGVRHWQTCPFDGSYAQFAENVGRERFLHEEGGKIRQNETQKLTSSKERDTIQFTWARFTSSRTLPEAGKRAARTLSHILTGRKTTVHNFRGEATTKWSKGENDLGQDGRKMSTKRDLYCGFSTVTVVELIKADGCLYSLPRLVLNVEITADRPHLF